MFKAWLAARNRIVLWIIIPFFLVGLTISALSVYFWTKPVTTFIENRNEDELKLASDLGIQYCEDRLNELLNLRLENDPEMVSSMRTEAIKEVIGINKAFSHIQMMIVENGDTVVGTSSPDLSEVPVRLTRDKAPVMREIIGKKPVRMHFRYFPFWRWHIISFIYESDYLGPVLLARETVYMASIAVLLFMTATILFLFNRILNKPLTRIIHAAEGIAQGRYTRLRMTRRDEIGKLAQAFDSMVKSLEDDKNWIHAIMSKLKESEERYRLLSENSLANIVIVQDGRFIYANRTTINNSGYSADELYHLDVFSFVHPEDHELVRQKMFSETEDEPLPDRYEFRYVTSSGDTRWLEMLAVPTFYRGKTATMGHAIDITDKKNAQEEQKKLEEKLQQAQKLEAIGTIVGAVAHDLNNILAGLVGYPDLLLMQTPEDSPHRKYILAIQQSGQKAAAIVQDLLAMVRKGVVVKGIVNLNDIIKQFLISSEFEKVCGTRENLKIESKLDSDLLNTSGSQTHLFKSIVNLVYYAAESSGPDGIIRIRTENRYVDRDSTVEDGPREGEYVVVSVSDGGTGISEADLARIFEPFYAKKVLGRGGTGLGMTMVWSTVKDHSGYAQVKTEEGNGTTIELYFPANRDALPDKQAIPSFDSHKGTETVLVVDDVKEQRELAREFLTSLGYTVHLAASGEEALEYFTNNGSADLLVLDMIMDPGIDGLETYKRILDLRPAQRAIIASGYSESDRLRGARKLGAKTCIIKPYTLQKLALAVREELNRCAAATSQGDGHCDAEQNAPKGIEPASRD